MTTLHGRALATLLTALTLAGCASQGAGLGAGSRAPEVRGAVRVDNQSRERIDVYLIDETRDWPLGRLEAGATAWLALPAHAPAARVGMVRLAVLAGAVRALQPSRDARAVITLKQPVRTLVGQRWVFAQGQLTGL